MKKIVITILSILLIICLSFSLVGCGDDGSDNGGGNGGKYITITYYDEFSTDPQSVTILKETTENVISVNKVGYIFKGLYDSQTSGVQIFNSLGQQVVPLTKNTILYARFEKKQYKKGFVVNGYGSIDDKTLTVSIGDTITTLREPNVFEGYTLIGWKAGENGPLISDGNIVKDEYMHVSEETSSIWLNETKFYAEIAKKSYNVAFHFNDGSYDIENQKISHGGMVTSTPLVFDDPNDDKEFIGWSMSKDTYIPYENSPACKNVKSDINIYGYWRYSKQIKLVIIAGEWEEFVRVYNDEPFIFPEYNYPGYKNDGWFTTPRFDRAPVSSIPYTTTYTEYYARWELENYKITFELNGGYTENGQNSIRDITYQMGEEFSLPEVEKENYTFLGWCEKRDLSDTPRTKITEGEYGNKSLFAKFRGDYKRVNYNLDMGSIAFDYKEIEYGSEYQLDIPLYEGYGFCGWYLDEGFTEQLTDKNGMGVDGLKWKILDEETNVYAKFAKKYYVTIIHSIEGAGSCEVEEYYAEGDRVSLYVENEEQYKVKGIMLSGNMVTNKDNYSFTMPNKDMQFTIVYEANKYTITLQNDEGAYISTTSKVVSYGEKYTLPTPIKRGHKFMGWEHDLGYMVEQVTDADGNSINAFTFTENVTFIPCFIVDPTNTDILITSANDFINISGTSNATYQLVRDIDMFGKTWTPCDFNGTLNGNGFKIKNLSIFSNSGNLAVFNTVTGKINDVTFENLSVISSCYDHVAVAGVCVTLKGTFNSVYATGSVVADDGITGGLVAILEGGTIDGCNNALAVTGLASEGDRGTGGIVGVAKGGKIINCENTGAIEGKFCTGGILGRTAGTNLTNISYVTNSGKVSGKDYAGGVIGYYAHTGQYTIQNLSNSGKVVGENYVGGVIGAVNNTYTSGDSNVRIFNLNVMTNSGEVFATGSKVGGVIGNIVSEARESGSYPYPNGKQKLVCREFTNTGNVTGDLTVGGIIGYVSTDDASSEFIKFSSTAKITATGIVGGIVGESNNIIIQNATNTGTTFFLESTYIDGSNKYAYVGGYIGRAYSTDIIGATNQVDISYEKISCTGAYIGGIAGVSTGTFTDCENTGEIHAPYSSYVGGIAGKIYKTGEYTSQRLSNSGKINAISYVGGIFGELENSYTSGDNNMRRTSLNELVNTASIEASGNYVGGIIGRIYLIAKESGSYPYPNGTQIITARKFINSADVKGELYVGGIVGSFYSDSANSEFIEPKSKANIVASAYVGGLFGQCENAKITNPDNSNSTIVSMSSHIDGDNYYAYIGGYVGKALGAHIENAINNVNIIYDSSASRGNYIGGICGYSTGTFTNCENKALIQAPNSSYVGGIAGSQEKIREYTIKNVKNSGNIYGTNYIAGIFGNVVNTYTSGDSNERFAYLIDVSNQGDIYASGNYVGGIVGSIKAEARENGSYPYPNGKQAYSLQNVQNSGTVEGVDYVGGIAGYAKTDSANAQVVSYMQTGTINGQSNTGDVFGYAQNLTILS